MKFIILLRALTYIVSAIVVALFIRGYRQERQRRRYHEQRMADILSDQEIHQALQNLRHRMATSAVKSFGGTIDVNGEGPTYEQYMSQLFASARRRSFDA